MGLDVFCVSIWDSRREMSWLRRSDFWLICHARVIEYLLSAQIIT
jgi:hypothetical protein